MTRSVFSYNGRFRHAGMHHAGPKTQCDLGWPLLSVVTLRRDVEATSRAATKRIDLQRAAASSPG